MKGTPVDMRGIYLRKKTFWFRFSLAGKQHRVNLHTHDPAEAVKLAADIRRNGPREKKISGTVWKGVISQYVAEKLADGSFRPGTASRVKSALTVFSERCGAPSPDLVTFEQLKAYYDTRRKNSEAGARSTMAMIQAFLSHIGNLRQRLKYDKRTKPNARQVVVPLVVANEWIAQAHRDDLRFVLFCGFHAGMRAGEIRFSRVEWFDLDRELIVIPAEERQVLPSGKQHLWKTKDSDPRDIPIFEEFLVFLREFLKGKKGHILRAPRNSGDGLWDFGTTWDTFVKKMGREEVFPHAMRHSWITELCNSGNHEITEIASWSGDTIETIEANYWKRKTRKGALNETLRGVRKGSEQAALVQQIAAQVASLVEQGKLDTSDVGKAVTTLIDRARDENATLEELLRQAQVTEGEMKL